ncbi:MAG: hypothetical protein ACE5GI_03465 [Candidatus Aminicenantales bacterium]
MSEAKTKEIKITILEELFTLFLPEKTLRHFNNARKEMLLALRSLIDARIEAFEKRKRKEHQEVRKSRLNKNSLETYRRSLLFMYKLVYISPF